MIAESSNELEQDSVAKSVAQLQRQLRSPDTFTRRKAAEALGGCGAQGEGLLRRALVDTDAGVRKAALGALSEDGMLGTQDTLLELLGSDYLDVRQHAARLLGELGDDRALRPLMEVCSRCFAGQPVRQRRRMGRWILLPWFLVAGATLWSWGSGHCDVKDLTLLMFFAIAFIGSRSRGEAWRVYLEAILKIAERNPRPELHQLLPDLQFISGDRIQHYPEAREVARAAAARIEKLTATIQDLPLPAVAPAPKEDTLPIPVNEAPNALEPVELKQRLR
jgi:hypothetical protein